MSRCRRSNGREMQTVEAVARGLKKVQAGVMYRGESWKVGNTRSVVYTVEMYSHSPLAHEHDLYGEQRVKDEL
jgi:hypothetical protein